VEYDALEKEKSLIRVAIIGSILGKHPGYPKSMGEILAGLLEKRGHKVIVVSSRINKIPRLVDIITTIITRYRSIDVQIIQVYSGPSFLISDAASLLGKFLRHKIIMHVHGGLIPEFMTRHPNWTHRVFSRADAIITPSTFLARFLDINGFQAQVIPNIVEIKDYPFRTRSNIQPRMLWMRTFHPIYNPEMAVRVLSLVRKTFPTATLVFAGQDKGSQANIQALVIQLGLESAVDFPGFLYQAGKAQHGNTADIYLNTNHADNAPVSIIEACAMGLPIVATNVGGISDLLTDEETGLLVPDGDVEAMTVAVLRLLQNPDLAAKLSTNARRMAETFDWGEIYPQWEALFARLLR
jgi:L-malate glycosyltransferase